MTAPLPVAGDLTVTASPEEAARDAGFVQESVPEREALKRDLIAAAGSVTPAGVVIASSTSGLLPSRLQAGVPHPERVVVGHPFHPVYLLPLVEVVGGSATSGAAVDRATDVYRSVGMHPLVLSTEIDGFVADRLLEALWREALWLVHDGVATVAEIDDAIRFGAGLRWSFMGTFLTYRIAGGEAGMRHFMAQFGPALQWPWTKLVDVPELTDDLLDRLVAQSDAQAAGRSVRELEAERDACLVAVLQALRSVGVGAGVVVDRYERTLFGRAEPDEQELREGHPLTLVERIIPTEWVDYNGHTTFHHGLRNLSVAVDAIKREFPDPSRIVVAGSSAGGYGTFAGYGVTRVAFPETPILVFNDSGPGLQNLNASQDVLDRTVNWNFTKRIPPSCTECATQYTYLLDWAFQRDSELRR
jgi:carnitine 3-dehydrogenase